MQTKHYDAIVIGFGKGGKTLSTDLARLGKDIAIIEKSTLMYGGTCINVGCIPTKSLVHNAKFCEKHSYWDFNQKSSFYKQSINEKNELVSFLRNKNYHLLADNPQIDVITGTASFEDNHQVKVKTYNNEDILLSADKIFINTGAKEFIPNIKGVENKGVFTSKTLLDYDKLPKTMSIIGGGYIGLEFASMYSSFGSKVTVIEFGQELISREDRDVADSIKQCLEEKGVRFILNADTKEIRQRGENNIIVYKDRTTNQENEIESEIVLIAIGRRPNIEGLNLEKAGVETTERGAIKTNEYLQTSQNHIYAMGDVAGNEQFTYISLDDYRIVLDNLNGKKEKSISSRKPIPYSVFIDPPFSRIGMNEKEIKEKGIDYSVATLSVAGIPRARLLNQTQGMLKIMVNKQTKKILGCVLFCVDSHEMINIVSMAMKMNVDYTFLRDFIFTHPTMSEALNDLCKQINL